MKVRIKQGDTLESISEQYLGSTSFAPSVATLNNLGLNASLVPGNELDLGNFANGQQNRDPYATAYANTLPINPTIRQGLQDQQNPYRVATDKTFQDQLKAYTNQIFEPYANRLYQGTIVPQRIQEAQRQGEAFETFAGNNALQSSAYDRFSDYLKQASQLQISSQTDQIKDQVERQKFAEEQNKTRNYLQFLDYFNTGQVLNDYIPNPNAPEARQTLANLLQSTMGDMDLNLNTERGRTLTDSLLNVLKEQDKRRQDSLFQNSQSGEKITTLPTVGATAGSGVSRAFVEALNTPKGSGADYITQNFGMTPFARSATGRKFYGSQGHTGVDLVFGDFQVPAPTDGEVVKNTYDRGFGNMVEIRANDGTIHRIAHLASKAPVTVGQKVSQGSFLGTMGSTGSSTAAHVHWDIRDSQGKYINPFTYIETASAPPDASRNIASENNSGYNVEKIQNIIDQRTNGRAPVTAEDFIRVSRDTGVPIDLMLAQAIQESNIGTLGRAVGTKNIFNVGNVDSGANEYQNDWLAGMYRYANLIKNNYARDPSNIRAEDFMTNFVNKSGYRYASDPNYENAISRLVSKIRRQLS